MNKDTYKLYGRDSHLISFWNTTAKQMHFKKIQNAAPTMNSIDKHFDIF